MKRIVLLLAVSLVAAACSSAGEGSADVGDGSTSPTTQATSTDAPGGERPDGPDAPNFTFALASGESFTLYDQQKPVYMIFWAEW